MKFDTVQTFRHTPDEVIGAFTSRELYASCGATAKLSAPELVDISGSDTERIVKVRYRLIAELPPAALVVVEPAKLSWVEVTTYSLDAMTASVHFELDHYQSKLSATAQTQFVAQGSGTTRSVAGELRVKILLGAGAVERVIIGDLVDHLTEQATQVDTFLD